MGAAAGSPEGASTVLGSAPVSMGAGSPGAKVLARFSSMPGRLTASSVAGGSSCGTGAGGMTGGSLAGEAGVTGTGRQVRGSHLRATILQVPSNFLLWNTLDVGYRNGNGEWWKICGG